ncbi:MAG TPA: tetratricopeptide repeat protein [Vicinamibacteria bacterium]|nr:tetratricopeptide repeat protein [Vicinamibacteria bacterium]
MGEQAASINLPIGGDRILTAQRGCGSGSKKRRRLPPAGEIRPARAARDAPGAIPFARQAIVLDSQFWIGYYQLGQAYEQTGDTDRALEALDSAARLSNNNSKAISLRGYLWARTGKAEAARDVLTTLEAVSRERYVPPYAIALVHAGLGEREPVFAWLDKAYAAHDVHLALLPVDPKWDPYRADPRFAALLTRCGFMKTATTAPPQR